MPYKTQRLASQEDLIALDRVAGRLEEALDLRRPLRRYTLGPDGEPVLDIRALCERLIKLPNGLTRDDG